jgi:hypothetical protein
MKDNAMFRIVKILGIGYITMIFFIFAFIFGFFLDRFFVNFYGDDYKNTRVIVLIFEILNHIIVLGILAYFVRVAVRTIPFPLDGLYGYQHIKLREMDGGVFYAILIMFQYHMQDKIIYTSNKIVEMFSKDSKKNNNK